MNILIFKKKFKNLKNISENYFKFSKITFNILKILKQF